MVKSGRKQVRFQTEKVFWNPDAKIDQNPDANLGRFAILEAIIY